MGNLMVFVFGMFCGSVATFAILNYYILTKLEKELAQEEHEVGSLK